MDFSIFLEKNKYISSMWSERSINQEIKLVWPYLLCDFSLCMKKLTLATSLSKYYQTLTFKTHISSELQLKTRLAYLALSDINQNHHAGEVQIMGRIILLLL